MANILAVVVALGAAWSGSAHVASDPYFCTPHRKEICNFDKPCEVMPADDFVVVLDDTANTYTRCDKPEVASCSTYGMVKSGDYKHYVTFEMPGRGGFSKIGPDGDWAEAVSLGGMIVVSHGMCFRDSALKK